MVRRLCSAAYGSIGMTQPTMSCLVVIALVMALGAADASEAEKRLLRDLLRDYDVNVRPVRNWSQTLHATIDVTINQIIDVNEIHQYVTLLLWFRFHWNDDSFRWNPTEYDNIRHTRLQNRLVWKPDIILGSSLKNFLNLADGNDLVVIEYNTNVRWDFRKVVKSACPMNVHYYPWDIQVCKLAFGPWTYPVDQVSIENFSTQADLSNYESNGVWDLLAMPCGRQLDTYRNSTYSNIYYYLVIRRKPLYYLFNFVLPSVFITITALLSFCLPAESGEKVSLNVTVLLSMDVFLLMVSETMPVQSDSIPLIGQFVAAMIIILALSTTSTVFVLTIHHHGALRGDVSPRMRRLVFEWLAKLIFRRHTVKMVLDGLHADDQRVVGNKNHKNHAYNNSECENPAFTMDYHNELYKPSPNHQNHNKNPLCSSQMDDYLRRILLLLDQMREEDALKKTDTRRRGEWMLVAYVVDRFMFYIFVISATFISAIILTQYEFDPQVNDLLAYLNINT